MHSNRQSYICFAVGTTLMLFSNGRWVIPLATWLYPIFLLRFMRMQKPAKGFLLIAIASAIIYPIMWWKMIPFPLVFYFVLTSLIFQLFSLGLLADRLLATRMKGFVSTLVFPITYCTIEYLMATLTPKGTWTSLAYTQSNNLVLMQIVSVTGLCGIIFIVTWFASLVNWAWDQKFRWGLIRRGSIIFGCIAGLIFLFGSIRLNFFQQQDGSVLTASIVQARSINKNLSTCKWTDANAIEDYSADDESNLLEKTGQAADAGAKIILWQEAASWLPKMEEEKFISDAMSLAAQKRIYLLMTLWSVPADFPKHKVENKLIVIDPDGNRKLTYIKNNPAPPEPIIKGNGVIPVIPTPYGKIAMAICADADYSGFIRQAGKNKADIMFIPANDWKAIDPIHSHMAITRAIENGFSLVHPAGQGLSVATDNRGRIISSMDFYRTDEQIMYANVPTQHANTVYPIVGDLFAWICVITFVCLLVRMIFRKYFLRANESQPTEEATRETSTSVNMG